MRTELTLACWMIVIALVQIILPALFRNRETGIEYNAGPRDHDGPPVGIITGRLQRAQRNLFEALPLFFAAVLIVHAAGRESNLSLIGAWLYVIARIVYIPAYGFGIAYLRSLIWLLSIVGLLLILAAAMALL